MGDPALEMHIDEKEGGALAVTPITKDTTRRTGKREEDMEEEDGDDTDQFKQLQEEQETAAVPTVIAALDIYDIRGHCCPHRASKQAIPLVLCIAALILTYYGSWSCNYFDGADIGFTGGKYGLWTIQDVNGKCQLYDVLFFAINLGPALGAARFMSMAGMVFGLAMATSMTQALQYHVVSWGIGVIFLVAFLISLVTTHIFNVWIFFWIVTYLIYTIMVRALFIHPYHRRISKRGSRIIAGFMVMCALFTGLTLVVLSSDYCTCSKLDAGDLENRIVDSPCDQDKGHVCKLNAAGYCMIVACILWLCTAVATQKIGVQPEIIRPHPTKTASMYANFSRESITTQAMNLIPYSKGRTYDAELAAVTEEENDGENGDGNGAQDEPVLRRRTFCEKCCCDFRVKERTRKETIIYWLFRVMLVLLFVAYLLVIVVMIGSRVQNGNAERAPDTTPYFVLDPVCGLNEEDDTFMSFPNAEGATAAGYKVAHCGECAYCSNMADIKTYVDTRKTIAISAKQCGPKAVLGSYDGLVECLEGKINFSRDCTKCWADDMKTDTKSCLFTCMNTMFTGLMTNNNVPNAGAQGWMNHCFFCDEKLAGPAFVTCSGVARRRLAITSEIERDSDHICKSVDVDWLTYFDDE